MRSRTKRRIVLACCAVLASALIAPAAAAAGQGSALDQYIESVPGASGDNPSHDLPSQNGSGSGHQGESLPPGAQQSLEQLGQAGQATAALAAATSPGGSAGQGSEGGGAGSSDATGGDEGAGGDNGVVAAATRLFDPAPGGVGLLLPLTLIGTVVVGVAFVLRRRMGKSGTGS
jgi:hypothetical protein